MKRVVIGLSGGVDSSVAAYLLKQQGYDVVGLFMINWHETTGTLEGDCPWEDDLLLAKLVARKLDISLHTVDFSDEYRKRIVNYMFSEYEKGRTPNPDVLCNREVKFDLFLHEALKFDADYIATGHYCQKEIINESGKEIQRLLAGKDLNKDQSYFLCQVSQEQLKRALFPIGHMHKFQVREIAEQEGLATAQRKDSQGLCFIGKIDLPTFLQQKLQPKDGITVEIPEQWSGYTPSVINLDSVEEDQLGIVCKPYIYKVEDGIKVGEHRGAHYYTIGQNKGLNIGGRPKQSYVIGIDTQNNVLYTGQGKNHPGLYRYGLFIPKGEVHWVRPDLTPEINSSEIYQVRIRYRQPLQKAKLFHEETGLYIIFEKPQRGITPGQFAAWYLDGEVIGSGVIQG